MSTRDVLAVAEMVLSHRSRDVSSKERTHARPIEDKREKEQKQREQKSQGTSRNQNDRSKSHTADASSKASERKGHDQQEHDHGHSKRLEQEDQKKAEGPISQQERIFDVGSTFKVRSVEASKDRHARSGRGRRTKTYSKGRIGRYVRSRIPYNGALIKDIAVDATLRAAAPYQMLRQKTRYGKEGLIVETQDLRIKVRRRRVGNLLVFVLDASGSMGAQRRMEATKGAIMSLLLDAYQKRDQVALVVFRGFDAKMVLPPTDSIELAANHLKNMAVGGKTPLTAGLSKASQLVLTSLRQDPELQPIVIMVTDGKCNVSLMKEARPLEEMARVAFRIRTALPEVKFLVIDTEIKGPVRLGLAKRLSGFLRAQYLRPEDLQAKHIIDAIQGVRTWSAA